MVTKENSHLAKNMDTNQLMNQISIVKDKLKVIDPFENDLGKIKTKWKNKIRSSLTALFRKLIKVLYQLNFISENTFLMVTHKCWYNSDENPYIQTTTRIIIMGLQYPPYYNGSGIIESNKGE